MCGGPTGHCFGVASCEVGLGTISTFRSTQKSWKWFCAALILPLFPLPQCETLMLLVSCCITDSNARYLPFASIKTTTDDLFDVKKELKIMGTVLLLTTIWCRDVYTLVTDFLPRSLIWCFPCRQWQATEWNAPLAWLKSRISVGLNIVGNIWVDSATKYSTQLQSLLDISMQKWYILYV